MTRWPDSLSKAPPGGFWSTLEPADRQAIADAGTVRALRRGMILAREGHPPDQVWLLLSGRVEVARDHPAGYRTVLAIRGAGDLIGELSAIDGGLMSATAVATENGSGLALVADRFAELCRQRPMLARAVTAVVVRRLRASDDGRVRLRWDVRDRTVLALLDLSGSDRGPVVLRITQQALADLVSAALISVTRTLDELRDLGVINTTRGRIEILDPHRLHMLVTRR